MEKVRISPKIRKLIDEMSIEELQFFNNVAKNRDFPKFKEYIRRMIDYEKEYFFSLPEEDAQKLIVEKAFARGKVAALTELLYTITGSQDELEKRLKD